MGCRRCSDGCREKGNGDHVPGLSRLLMELVHHPSENVAFQVEFNIPRSCGLLEQIPWEWRSCGRVFTLPEGRPPGERTAVGAAFLSVFPSPARSSVLRLRFLRPGGHLGWPVTDSSRVSETRTSFKVNSNETVTAGGSGT